MLKKFDHKFLSAAATTLACLLLMNLSAGTVSGQNKAQSPPDPRSILADARQAILGLKSVSYDAAYEGGNKIRTKGHVAAARGGSKEDILPGRVYIKSEGTGGTQEISFDGKIGRRLNHDKKTLTEGIAEKGGVAVALTASLTLLSWDFIWDEPLKFVSKATAAEYLGQASVEGVLCHVIDLQYSVPGTDVTGGRWWFAVDDKLPRMIQVIDNPPTGKFMTELRISDLQIGDGIAESKFKLELPEGYAYQSFNPTGAKPKFIPVGENAPDWLSPDNGGQEQRLSGFRGQVVVLEFWASWCGYCKLSIPEMQALHEKYKEKNVKILGVNFQELEGVDPVAYLKSKGAAYPTLINGDKIAAAYGVIGVPVFYVIDAEGRVAFVASSYNPNIKTQLEEAIQRALLSGNQKTKSSITADKKSP